jgi:hypothetical protein
LLKNGEKSQKIVKEPRDLSAQLKLLAQKIVAYVEKMA